MPDVIRCSERLLRQYVPACSLAEGDMVEIGVYTGCSAELISDLAPHKTLHLFDTFDGIPASQWREGDGHRPGEFRASEQKVRERFKDKPRIRFHVGVFPETIPDNLGKICFLHLDCDISLTAKLALEWAWPRLTGVIVVDDYGFGRCRKLQAEVDTFYQTHDDVECEIVGQRAVLSKYERRDNSSTSRQQGDSIQELGGLVRQAACRMDDLAGTGEQSD